MNPDEIGRVGKIRETLHQQSGANVKDHRTDVEKLKGRMTHEETAGRGIHSMLSIVSSRINECRA